MADERFVHELSSGRPRGRPRSFWAPISSIPRRDPHPNLGPCPLSILLESLDLLRTAVHKAKEASLCPPPLGYLVMADERFVHELSSGRPRGWPLDNSCTN